jgi:hypothetical protein
MLSTALPTCISSAAALTLLLIHHVPRHWLRAGGSLEFVFVLEDKTDPAHAVISALIRELQGRRPVRVQSAGFAEHTSQKIHKWALLLLLLLLCSLSS